jgi:hypothetical protein
MNFPIFSILLTLGIKIYFLAGNTILNPCAYAPATVKKSKEKICAYILTFYVHTSSFTDNQFLLCHVQKKIKKMSREESCFSTKFCPFYRRHKKYQFFKRLCEHIEHRDVCATFFVDSFDILNMLFKNQEHMDLSAKSPCPSLLTWNIIWYNHK